MILEKEVEITLTSRNVSHFENLGYNIVKEKDKYGSCRLKKDTTLKVKVNDLTHGSNATLTKICDFCGKTSVRKYKQIIRFRKSGDGKDRCNECARLKGATTQKRNIRISLEKYAIEKGKLNLLQEYSSKNTKSAKEITYGTNEECIWNCFDCDSEYEMRLDARTSSNNGCPYCRGMRVNHTNSLAAIHPDLIKEWDEVKNKLSPIFILPSNESIVWWKCSQCKHEFQMKVRYRSRGTMCPNCSESRGEKRIRKWLLEKNIKHESQKSFSLLRGVNGGMLSYDFYLPECELLIEYQGQFHDGSNGQFTKINLNVQKEHDKRKREYTSSHGIELLCIWHYEFENIEDILKQKIQR